MTGWALRIGLGFMLLAAPLAAEAQQANRVWRIGFLSSASGPTDRSESFVQGLRDLGYVEGQNLIVGYRWAAGKNERLAELATELIGAGVDVIVTTGTPATLAAKQATRTLPIVFGSAALPVENGLVASLARPGGNVTGIALVVHDVKTLDLLKETAPGISRVAYVYDPATLPGTHELARLALYQDQARGLDITLEPVALRAPDETDRVFAALTGGTRGLLITSSSINILARDRICTLATQRRLPAIGTDRSFANAGCLMSYGENLPDLYRRAAGYVDRILKGAKPADLPVEQPTKFELVINLKTAKALGVTIPPSLLQRADQVIE
jgi:putative ABC transport system substrate-binding protein